MELKDKQELVRLLNLYQADLLETNLANIKSKKGDRGDFEFGVKAQYDHARIIANKLSVEISKDVVTYI